MVTCEHGGNHIPEAYHSAFEGADDILNSHRGYDAGALPLARSLAAGLGAHLCYSETSRLLIDLNRSMSNSEVWSEYSRGLPSDEIIAGYYSPYRNDVESWLRSLISTYGKVIHLSIHSFTPVWMGEKRRTDLGLLFDDDRHGELAFASSWRDRLVRVCPEYQIDFNKPYHGKDDGFTTYLRTIFSDEQYVGIELEVNQRFANIIEDFFNPLILSLLDIEYENSEN